MLKSNARPFGDRREAVFRLRRVLSFEVLVREARDVPSGSRECDAVVDVSQQCVDRGTTRGLVRPQPPIASEACAHFAFGLFSEGLHPSVDDRGARALRYGVPGTQNPRRPEIVTFEGRRRCQAAVTCGDPGPLAGAALGLVLHYMSSKG